MRTFISLCVILSLLSEDRENTACAFQESASPKVSPVTISLAQALERVKRVHPDLKLQALALQRATDELKLATRAFFPDLDLDTIASSAAGGPGVILSAARLLTPLFSLKSLLAEREVRKLLQEKEKVLIRQRELETREKVTELYVTFLFYERLLEVSRRNYFFVRKRLHLKRTHYREGGMTKEEFLKEKLALEASRTREVMTRVFFKRSEGVFKRLLGIPPEASLKLLPLELGSEAPFPLSLEGCFLIAEKRNPLIESLRLKEKASQKERDKTPPRFVVDGFFVGWGESGDLFQGRPRLGAQGNLTFYDWGKRKIRRHLRSLTHESLLLEDQKELEVLAEEIEERYSELLLLEEERVKVREEFLLRRESRRRSELLAGAGRVRPEEVFRARGESLEARAQVFGKRLEYYLVRERLLKDLGLSGMSDLKEELNV